MVWVQQVAGSIPGGMITGGNHNYGAVTMPNASIGVGAREMNFTQGSGSVNPNGDHRHWNIGLNYGGHEWVPTAIGIADGPITFPAVSGRLGVPLGAFNTFQFQRLTAGNASGQVNLNSGSYTLYQWMPAPAQTGVSVDSVTHNSARVVSASPPNTGRPTTTRIWQLATGAASTAVSHQVSTGNQTTGSFTGLAGNTTYRARVINRNATGDSAASPWVNFTTRPAPPAATAVVVDQIKWNGARLASARPAATGAALQRRWQVEQVGGGLVWSQTTGDVLEAAATGLQGSTAYRARVQNFNTTGDAAWSAWAEFTTAPAERAWIGGKEMARAFIGGISVGELWQAGQRVWNRP